MKALVTGAAGFIGSHLSGALLDAGAAVTGIDCFTDYYPRALKEANLATVRGKSGFTFVEGALQDLDLKPALAGVTHVFHLAAQAGVRKSWGRDFDVYTRNNVKATQRLLEALVGTPIQKYVYASSSSVYGDHVPLPMREDAYLQPLSPYGVSKLAAEHLGHLYWANHGVPAVSLRYFTVYGPRQRPDMGFQRFLTAVAQGKPITVYGDGEQTRDFTFVSDIVAANLAAAERGQAGSVYNIGGGSRVTLNHVLKLIERVTGKAVTIHREPDQKGDMRHTYADTSLARRDLGFAPRVSLESGLDQQYRWLTTMNTSQFALSLLLCLVVVSGCSSNPPLNVNPADADHVLLDHGNAALKDRRWTVARQYFSELLESYPQSPLRAEAKLGVGDTFLGENNSGILRLRPERVSRVPRLLPDQPASRLRADAAWDGAFQPDAQRAARPDRDQGSDSRVSGLRGSLSQQPTAAAGEAAAARGEGPALRLRTCRWARSI